MVVVSNRIVAVRTTISEVQNIDWFFCPRKTLIARIHYNNVILLIRIIVICYNIEISKKK